MYAQTAQWQAAQQAGCAEGGTVLTRGARLDMLQFQRQLPWACLGGRLLLSMAPAATTILRCDSTQHIEMEDLV